MTTWPQPHEGVTGTDREDWLLSEDPKAVAHREAIRVLAYHLQTATLVGDPAPVVARMSARLRDPQIGDLVVEQSTMHRRDPDTRLKGMGILLARRREWWETDEDWEQSVAQERAHYAEHPEYGDWDEAGFRSERSTDDAWYIQYGSQAGDICRWTNCSFLVVPIHQESFAIPAGFRDGTATVFTRDSLLGGLADSGFKLNLGGDSR